MARGHPKGGNTTRVMGWAESLSIAAAATPSVFRTNGLDPKVEIAYEIRSAVFGSALGSSGHGPRLEIALLSDCIGNRICQSISSRAVGKTSDWSQAGVDTQPITTSAARF